MTIQKNGSVEKCLEGLPLVPPEKIAQVLEQTLPSLKKVGEWEFLWLIFFRFKRKE